MHIVKYTEKERTTTKNLILRDLHKRQWTGRDSNDVDIMPERICALSCVGELIRFYDCI